MDAPVPGAAIPMVPWLVKGGRAGLCGEPE